MRAAGHSEHHCAAYIPATVLINKHLRFRGKRKGEVDGKDYHFVSKEQFESWIKAGELLEHAVVYGEYKGIPRQQVTNALARGTDVVMRIDVQGAATIRRLMPDAIFVFLVWHGLSCGLCST